MSFSSHSEYLPLVSVLLNPVRHAFASQEKLKAEWQALNYTCCPDYEKALNEYDAFEKLLLGRGVTCEYLPPSVATSTDALYSRDASIVTNYGVILCQMGKPGRRKEPGVHEAYYRSQSIPVLGRITPPGTLEGGDVAWLDSQTLAVAHSYRTNPEGIAQLKTMLAPYPIQVLVVELPHYKGPGDVFHLMSAISPVAKNTAVVYSPLLPIAFRNTLLAMGYQLVEVPEEEFDSMACNVLAISPGTCIMVSGNPKTQGALRKKGFEVLTYSGKEISIKGGGGPTCLTRPLKRQASPYILR